LVKYLIFIAHSLCIQGTARWRRCIYPCWTNVGQSTAIQRVRTSVPYWTCSTVSY